MALTKVSPSLFQVSNNITSVTVGGSANTISLTFDSNGVITGASNNAVSVANTAITGNIISSQIASVNGSVITANTIANSAIQTGAVENYMNAAGLGFGMRNRIINGAMAIDQRNAGASVTAAGAFVLDRFLNYRSGGAYTVQRSTTAPTGFINSMLMTNTTAASPTTYSFFAQPIEGLNVFDLAFGAASAATITISFWVRSSVTGIYSISVSNSNGDRAYPAQYTINAANTFEYKTITVPGDTSGTWLTNTSTGINLRFDLGSPSARTAAAGAWASGNYDGANGSTGGTTWANTTNATFYITGVQLEKGSTATSFDYRPIGTELALCQRYFQTLTQASNETMGFFVDFSTTALVVSYVLGVQMRTTPTYIATVTSYRQNGRLVDTNSTNTPVLTKASLNNGRLDLSGFTGLTAGDSGVLVTNSSGFTALTAEL